MPLHYVRRLTVVSLLVYTNTYGSDMYYNTIPPYSLPILFSLGKLSTSFFGLFCGRYPLVSLVVTIYHWIEKIFSIKTLENLFRLLLSNLVRIKKHVFVHYL